MATLTVLIVAVVAAVLLLALHLWWRRRFGRVVDNAKKAEEKLQAELARQVALLQHEQQVLFNSMVEGVLLLDPSNRVRIANRAFMDLFQLTAEVRGKTILEILRQPELADLMGRVADETQVAEFELTHTGQAERCLEVNAAIVSGTNGERRGTILVFHDLTRLKQLERTRQEFVANVSHELRTPLSLIKGYTETLLEGAKDDPAITTRFLQTIQRNAERLQFLIEDLLTISELESGRVTMNCQPVGLRGVVDKVLEDWRNQATVRDVTLMNEIGAVTVRADGDRLQQVLGNLIGNAIKYGRVGGRVAVQCARCDGGWQVCVRDDGPGIPNEALERVFERFYRVDKARSREQGGTGLGLAIVKHIIHGHGGRVWARSESGQGAAFYFTLPDEE